VTGSVVVWAVVRVKSIARVTDMMVEKYILAVVLKLLRVCDGMMGGELTVELVSGTLRRMRFGRFLITY
jgi:hypothetical protein